MPWPCTSRTQSVILRSNNWSTKQSTWADRLYPYAPLAWTNASWHCPTYIANGGQVSENVVLPGGTKGHVICTSYAYNAVGMVWAAAWPKLGLGPWAMNTASENAIQAPSEMFMVADARAFKFANIGGQVGLAQMQPWLGPGGKSGFLWGGETAPPHSDGYNMLFGDGHVALSKRKDYLCPPPRTAQNWNRDNQPHPELWVTRSE